MSECLKPIPLLKMNRSHFSVILLGDSSVGKSSMLQQLTEKCMDTYSTSTIGVDYFTTNISISNREVPLRIWDTAGQECYRSLATCYFRQADVAIIVFSLTDINSFRSISGWMKQLLEYAPLDIKVYVVGNKMDQVERGIPRCTTAENAKYLLQAYDINYYEVSSTRHQDIKLLFNDIATSLSTKIQGIREPMITPITNIKSSTSQKNGFKNCCCIT
jgi:small GTP-binding protein